MPVNTLPHRITKFNLFIDGYGLAAKIKNFKVPDLQAKKETYHPGGVGGEIHHYDGLEALESSFTLFDYDPIALSKIGFPSLTSITVTARGAAADKKGLKIPVAVRMVGNLSAVNSTDWERGSGTEVSFTMDCEAYRLSVAEKVIHDIDLIQGITVIGGVDQGAIDNALILRGISPNFGI